MSCVVSTEWCPRRIEVSASPVNQDPVESKGYFQRGREVGISEEGVELVSMSAYGEGAEFTYGWPRRAGLETRMDLQIDSPLPPLPFLPRLYPPFSLSLLAAALSPSSLPISPLHLDRLIPRNAGLLRLRKVHIQVRKALPSRKGRPQSRRIEIRLARID